MVSGKPKSEMAKLLQERVNILNETKQLLNSAFVEYEGLCGSRGVLSTEADNTLLNLQNFSYPTQRHSIIVNN